MSVQWNQFFKLVNLFYHLVECCSLLEVKFVQSSQANFYYMHLSSRFQLKVALVHWIFWNFLLFRSWVRIPLLVSVNFVYINKSYRQSCLRDEVVNGLYHITGVKIVVIGIAVVRIAELQVVQHRLQLARRNLEW